jgi:diaminopimelate decarboxylase
VGNIKKLLNGKTMVSLDTSTMNLLWILIAKWYYHPVVVNQAGSKCTEKVKLAGPLCWGIDWFTSEEYTGYDAIIPPVKRGDFIAFLDAGAYAQNMANCFNGFPRPGGVLVEGNTCEIIRVPETVTDLLSKDRVPARLLA